MDLPFSIKQETEKLAETREREEEDVAHILSSKYGMGYADLSIQEVDNDALRIITEEEARLAEAVAFAKVAKALSVAVHNQTTPRSLNSARVSLLAGTH